MFNRVRPGDEAARRMTEPWRKLAGSAGFVHDNMFRFAGWRFLTMGRARERADQMLSALAATRTIAHELHERFEFDPEATEVTTPPIAAFEARRGVCQDISHVTIAALRAVGIPAGYVSGFLRTRPPPGQPRLEGADAMHAWVRAWCGAETGWIEIDPTNNLLVGADHVAVAIGRDYADDAPVRGSLRSEGTHTTSHKVDVIPCAGRSG
ncbi:MAG TPA: hypothetical protein ENN83_16175 [Rhodovulum sp.]|nr:hypothetical protein [Rhodovulum sp.]